MNIQQRWACREWAVRQKSSYSWGRIAQTRRDPGAGNSRGVWRGSPGTAPLPAPARWEPSWWLPWGRRASSWWRCQRPARRLPQQSPESATQRAPLRRERRGKGEQISFWQTHFWRLQTAGKSVCTAKGALSSPRPGWRPACPAPCPRCPAPSSTQPEPSSASRVLRS